MSEYYALYDADGRITGSIERRSGNGSPSRGRSLHAQQATSHEWFEGKAVDLSGDSPAFVEATEESPPPEFDFLEARANSDLQAQLDAIFAMLTDTTPDDRMKRVRNTPEEAKQKLPPQFFK